MKKNITSTAEPMEVTGKKESDPDKTLDKADTKTNKGSDKEHLQQGLSNDHINKIANPTNRSRNKRGHISENSSHQKTPLDANETMNKTNTETNKGNDNESLNQRIRSDRTNKRTDPSHRRSDHATRIGKDSSESTNSRTCENTTFTKYSKEKKLCDMDQVSDDPNRNNDKGETDEITHRLSHKKTGKLS